MAAVLLIATQRSGTNMLRSVLGTHTTVCAIPEIFNDRRALTSQMPEDLPYFDEFLRHEVERDPDAAQLANRNYLVEEYFCLVEQVANRLEQTAVVDVKYSSLHHANVSWHRPSDPPKLFDIARKRRIRIIHLERADALATVLSSLRAEATQKYVVSAARLVLPTRFRVEPRVLVKRLETLKQDKALIRKWLGRGGLKVLEIRYEDLFTGDPGSDFNSTEFNRIAAFVGIDPSAFDLTPRTRKISPLSLGDEIENFDEIETTLRGTEYHQRLLARF